MNLFRLLCPSVLTLALANLCFSVHAQKLNAFYYNALWDSCAVHDAAYYYEYQAIPNDSLHWIRWTKTVNEQILAKNILFAQKKEGYRNYDGIQEYFWENGQRKRTDTYQNGDRIEGYCWNRKGQDTAYYIQEVKACFPGDNSQEAMSRFISEQLVYPKKAKKKGIQGKVLVSFVVQKDGRIDRVQVVQSVHPLLDEEAIRVIQSMPKWSPAINDGRPVRMGFTLSISFKL